VIRGKIVIEHDDESDLEHQSERTRKNRNRVVRYFKIKECTSPRPTAPIPAILIKGDSTRREGDHCWVVPDGSERVRGPGAICTNGRPLTLRLG